MFAIALIEYDIKTHLGILLQSRRYKYITCRFPVTQCTGMESLACHIWLAFYGSESRKSTRIVSLQVPALALSV
jgi:hypothetical protein